MLSSEVRAEITIDRTSPIQFPSVTICNYNQYRKSYFLSADNYKKALLATMYPDFMNMGRNLANLDQTVKPGYNATDVYKEAAHQIADMALVCFWEQKQENCTDIFETRYTDMGVCYTFNGDGSRQQAVAGAENGLKLIMFLEYGNYFYSEHLGMVGFKVHLPTFFYIY